mmetsp:Transcript_10631/g.17355  ORF Transcript_10631/g.17355 Transcript_10631/m.17355 type:complete len:398 (+) Transcript_10631:483-1676(+)|eukprot:CAMPEP_0203761852 /NCGR_PEP_ID=MMETSP0098-20131031/14855_1 /ASSEMBLY_ACC=CAM_ASM_000208 /TAXON_ID=96639 /ORGANISM=" , Strain NY0313808BC1" /LENGTH=397 /DNA_ID=CAMNT_0050656013 /DNA_START=267 /DNA_END=1460 /DNA_ORIENTATION=-
MCQSDAVPTRGDDKKIKARTSTKVRPSGMGDIPNENDKYTKYGRRVPSDIEKRLAQYMGLRYYEDLRTLMFCCIYFTVLFVQIRWSFESTLARIALFCLTSFLAFQGAVTVHNAIHCPIFKDHWKNTWFQVVISVWFGHCASSYVPGHNLSHHRNLQTKKDIMRTTKMNYRWNFLNGLLFMPTVLASTSSNDFKYFQVQRSMDRPIYYQLRLEAVIYVGLQLVLAIHSPKTWFFAYWLPCVVGKYMIISLNMLQHDGADPNSKYNHSRNFVGKELNYFCFNNGYHGIHHMYPGKHWALLKHEHETRVQPHIHPNLDWDNIFVYMFRQFIYPGLRVDYEGKLVQVMDPGEDEPWFYATFENYSDRNVDERVWDKNLNQHGPTTLKVAKREAKSYTTMQ